MKTRLACKYESKLKCNGMRESREEDEVLHKAPRNLLENLQHNNIQEVCPHMRREPSF